MNPKHLERCLGKWQMLTKYPWEGRTMRNTGPSVRLGPLQALDKEIIMPVLCWQSKPTKPSKAQGGNTPSAEPAVPSEPSCVPTEGPPDAPARICERPCRRHPRHTRGQPQTEAQRGRKKHLWSRPTMTFQVSQPWLERAELCNRGWKSKAQAFHNRGS